MNPHLAALHAYPFERLAALKAGLTPPPGLGHIAMSIGEPQHEAPAFVLDKLRASLNQYGSYPANALTVRLLLEISAATRLIGVSALGGQAGQKPSPIGTNWSYRVEIAPRL